MTDGEYEALKKQIRLLLRIDLDAYKTQQMRRRLDSLILRRMQGNVAAYCAAIGRDPVLLKELKDLLTINVSEFFRNPIQFEYLKSHVFPELLKRFPRLNIWNAGCSIGAETYSMAIILDELGAARRNPIRILATDIDDEVLGKATAGGPYSAADTRDAGDVRLRKYFRPAADGHGSYVIDTLKRGIEYRRHNLLSDRFEQNFHLISCRNVMIYFSSEAKSRLFHQFHDSLAPGGVLFIGGTEALLGNDTEGYERVFGNFYRKSERARSAA